MVQTKSDTYDDATDSTAVPSVINASGKDSDGEEDALQDPFMLAFVENFSQAVRRLAEANASNTGTQKPLCVDDRDLINSSIYVLLNMKLNLPENSKTREVLSQNTNIVESLFQASGVVGNDRRFEHYISCNGSQKFVLLPLFQLIGHFVSGRHVANIAAAYKNGALQRLHEKNAYPSAVDSLVLLKLDDQAEPGLLGLDDVPTIAAAMKRHINRGDAQEWGCSALKYILHHEETEDSPGAKENGKQAGGEEKDGEEVPGGTTNEGASPFGRFTTVKAEPAMTTGFSFGVPTARAYCRVEKKIPGEKTPGFSFGSSTAPPQFGAFGARKTFPNPNPHKYPCGPPAFGSQGVFNPLGAASTGPKDVAGAFTIADVLEVIADGFTKHVDHTGANREVIGFLQNLVERYPAFKPPLVKLGLVQHLGNILQKKVLQEDVQAAAKTLIMAVVT